MVTTMNQVKLGRAAELVFQAKCLLNGLECFTPVTEDGRVDLLVGPHHYRVQVKVLGLRVHASVTRYLSMVKRQGRAGSRVRFRYSKQDVDFMVGVCLDTMAVYVVPIASTAEWSHCISEQALERMETKEAFHLLSAAPGEAALPMAPRRVIGRRPHARQRLSRAWRDRNALLLGLDFGDDREAG
jgi:hypothetical protein